LSTSKIINIIQDITAAEINNAVTELNEKYLNTDASFRIRKIAGGYQVYITENYAGYVEELFTRRRTQKLTRAALETLAIIAYRQPVTRVDIEMIRGVSSDSAVRTLLERKFITLSGRAKTIGRPLLYSTTNEFLKYFSLNSLNDLPKMEEIEELLSAKEQESQQILAFEAAENSKEIVIPDEGNKIDEQSIVENDAELAESESDDVDEAVLKEIEEIEETKSFEISEEVEESSEPDDSKELDLPDDTSVQDSDIENPINRIEHLHEDLEKEIEDLEEDNEQDKETVNIGAATEDY
ncbi:MAG: SMC-Scp complex subunit ScpB, partial [candidate division Zixibacteria bacterium]|nr:SMC-Scp complex subunit ScpB [candidate division Zixibacteria bacterium]